MKRVLLNLLLLLALISAVVLLSPWSPLGSDSQEASSVTDQTFAEVISGREDTDSRPSASIDWALQSVEDLIQLTQHPDWGVRWDAVNALGASQDPQGVPALVARALYDDNPHPRWRSLWALVTVDPTGKEALPPLLNALHDVDRTVIRNAAVGLAFYGRTEGRLELVRGLQDPDDFRRWEAVFSLRTLGDPEVASALIPLLDEKKETDKSIRGEVALVLSRIGGEDAIIPLLNAMRTDSSPQVRWRASAALGQLGDTTLVSDLVAALAVEEDPEVRLALEGAIAQLGRR